MKKLLMLLMFLSFISLNSFANNSETDHRAFLFNGEQNFKQFNMFTEIMRREQRLVRVPATCYRDVPYNERVCRNETRYRQVCRTTPGRRVCRQVNCRNVRRCTTRNGRRVCRNVRQCQRRCTTQPGRRICSRQPYQQRVCRTVVRHRRESYTCYRNEMRWFDVLDKRTEAAVSFDFIEDYRNRGVKVNFNVDLRGEGLQVRAMNSQGNKLAVLAGKDIRRTFLGKTVQMDARFSVKLLDRLQFISPITQIMGIATKTKRGRMLVKVGKVHYPQHFFIKLKVKAGSKKIFERVLTKEDYQFLGLRRRSGEINYTNVAIDLSKLLGSNYVQNNTVEATLKVYLHHNAEVVLNGHEMPKLSVKGTNFILLD